MPTDASAIHFVNLQNQCDNGCYLFSRVIRFFETNGYRSVPVPGEASLIVFNTCAYVDKTAETEERRIEETIAMYPNHRIVIYGCLANFSRRFDNRPNIQLVPPDRFDLLDEWFARTHKAEEVESARLIGFDNYQSALTDGDYFVLCAQGCRHRCSYCNVRMIKGGVVSKQIETVVTELQAAQRGGIREATLLADDVGSYGVDIGTDLVELLDAIIAGCPGLKIKIYAMHPKVALEKPEDFARLVASGMISYICLPSQSGSQRIVDLMRRDQDLVALRGLLRRLKEVSPSIYLCTHIMFGFPTETEEDFQSSLELASQFDFTVFMPFRENARTPSARVKPKVPFEDLVSRENAILAGLNEHRFSGCLTGGQ